MDTKSLLGVMMSFCQSQNRSRIQASIIDALDTLLIMGLEDEYEEALEFVKKIDFTQSKDSSKGFETNIRYLGGLLSANDLRPNDILVQKAIEVTEATLIPLFIQSTSLGVDVKIPLTYMNLNTNKPESGNTINLAEFGTYTMEFTRLSQVTGDPKYEKLATDVINAAIQHSTRMPGLFPTSWTVHPFAPVQASTITIAGGGDSFYEYLIKNYLLQTDRNERHKEVWQNSVESIEEYMLSPTLQNPDIKYVAMIGNSTVYYSSQELICYWPGNILLGMTQMADGEKKNQYKAFADTFFESCIETWKKTETGIAPESWNWIPQNNELGKKLNALFENKLKLPKMKREIARSFSMGNHIYDLRPETIESDLAWSLYGAIEKYAKAGAGFTRVDDVDRLPIQVQDFQESFFFAETLKYLYLTFTDKNCISLDRYVFNTEAHPFILPEPIAFQA
ncbi:glycoside hydrolase [Mucor mucedo]|uniref:glycoside hydrolase n=1 Tax=Mucor mucedo TaxID=29922 RepID=UPI00221E75BD|nr:glycoside hydrolase [Mucor mucedo]KAI7894077.1 glycoside hydrolase [Mucor mucedo]